MKKIVYFYLGIFISFFVGCAPQITKQEFSPKMYTEHPISILVLPPLNKSTAADAKEYYTTTIAEPLSNSGYYVFPTEVVGDILKQEGLSDTETMMNVPPRKFREFFGADAVMFVTIQKWNTTYAVLSGSVTVQLSCELRSTTSGEILWFYDGTVTVNTSGDSGGAGGLAGLLVQAASTAIKTAATGYVTLAQKANEQILLAIPYGKYHKDYNLDGKAKIEKKDNANQKQEKK